MDAPLLPQSEHQKQAGYRFGQLLKALGVSQTKMAITIGVSKQRLNNWVNGVSYPDTYELYKMCRLANVDFNYVMLGDWAALPKRVAGLLEADVRSKLDPPEVPVTQARETL